MKWQAAKDEKLISFLQGTLGDHSGKFLRKVLEANCCKINGQIERFGSRKLVRGDVVELSPKWQSAKSQKLTFETLYEDESIKIINKPAGLICDKKNIEQGLYLVHRLDKDTTGVLILAKSQRVRDQFFELFEKRLIEKTYLAVVDGIPMSEEGELRSQLIKKGSYHGQTIWGSGPKGLLAITYWRKLRSGNRASLISLKPQTGRTHQLRVHMAEMNHPILVDRQYAKKFQCPEFSQRILLHAESLKFKFQGNEIFVKAPLFFDMQNFMQDIGI